jgi:hypothetical protein
MTPKAVVRAQATTGMPTLESMPRPQPGPWSEVVGDPGARPPPSRGPPSDPCLPGGPITPWESDASVGLGDGEFGPGPGEPLGPGVAVAGMAADGVGFAVARGLVVGFGVGLGVGFGFGFGALITTRLGDTALRMTLRAPAPEPLAALNRYAQRPAGNLRVTEYVTPPSYDVPDALMAYRPRPTTTSSTRVGAHPAPSLYRTLKVIRVDVVPDPGDAVPRLSCGLGCEAPLQLAARASRALDGASQHATARMTAMAPIFRFSDRWAMDDGSRS